MFSKQRAQIGKLMRRYMPQYMFIRDIDILTKMYQKVKEEADANAKMTDEEWESYILRIYIAGGGRELDLENPKRFTEKVQWRKLYDREPVYSRLSDKLAVREWVAETIGEEYLIPLLGVWDSPKDIDYCKLPNQFVLKTNNASKTNIICKDRRTFDKAKDKINVLMDLWLQLPFWAVTGEFQYKDIIPKIIAEKYIMPENGQSDLEDYKFYCFHGVPAFVEVHTNRSTDHGIAEYDLEWNRMDWLMDRGEPTGYANKPACFSEMVEIAKKLSKGFAHVRVDLYCIGQKVYFGEMTFTDGSGLYRTNPDRADFDVGSMWDIRSPQISYD